VGNRVGAKRDEVHKRRGGVRLEGDGLALISKIEFEGDRRDTYSLVTAHRGRRALALVGWGHCEPTKIHQTPTKVHMKRLQNKEMRVGPCPGKSRPANGGQACFATLL
jgi:hypothetical protein